MRLKARFCDEIAFLGGKNYVFQTKIRIFASDINLICYDKYTKKPRYTQVSIR